jgi:microcystin-dependent protein
MTTVQRTGIGTPATGLQVYDTDLNQLYFFNGSLWTAIANNTNYWTLTGGNIYNNTGTKIGIGNAAPSAKLHVGGGTRFTVLDTGAVFLQSGNTIGSARDWKMSVTLPNGNLSFRDMGFDNLNNGMAVDAMVMQWGTGNVGVGTNSPGQKLTVNGTIESLSGGIKFPDATIQTTAAIGIPTGSITMYAGTAVPAGYLVCDGAAINRVTYANLFTALGVAWGSGDGSTTFNLPDLRGRFPRGVDGGSGNDPNAAVRTASNVGGNTGNNVGSLQTDTLVSHSHVVGAYTASGGTHIALITAGTNNTQSTLRTEVEGGSETRPKNVYVYYIIRY